MATKHEALTARLPLPGLPSSVPEARRYTRQMMAQWRVMPLADDAELVAAELVTNAVLYSGGPLALTLHRLDHGVRVEVEDSSAVLPSPSRPLDDAMTGRGLLLVDALGIEHGVDPLPHGKIVWCVLQANGHGAAEPPAAQAAPARRAERPPTGAPASTGSAGVQRHPVRLGRVPTPLLLAAKTHVDNLVRELTLATHGQASGQTAHLPSRLTELVPTVTRSFGAARDAMREQARRAAEHGEPETELTLHLPLDAAETGRRYLSALDELDDYARSADLLTLATAPAERTFRHWYVESLIAQLDAIATGAAPQPAPPLAEWAAARGLPVG